MKIKISLASMNGHGAMAGIGSDDGIFTGELDIAGGEDCTPFEACRQAAKALRLAAARFDVLAFAVNPLHATAQAHVNDLADDVL